MQCLARGKAQYRTRLLTRIQADRFSRCLAANPRFTAVEVHESTRAKDPERSLYITFLPASQSRQAALLGHQHDARQARAQAEGVFYIWAGDPDFEYWHLLTLSGEVFEVDAEARECSCPDHQFRCKRAGLRCKHLLAYDANLGTYYAPTQWETFPAPFVPGRFIKERRAVVTPDTHAGVS